MDQESGSSRRRSSRLAARGVTPSKTESAVKKIIKTAEKPKRTKRKTTEDTIELPVAKKFKTEAKKAKTPAETPAVDEVGTPEESKVNNVETNEVSSVTPMDVVTKEVDDEPSVEKETEEEPVSDCKEQKEEMPVAKDEKETVDASPQKTLDKKPLEIIEEPIVEESDDVPQEKPVQEIALKNTNGNNDEKETVVSPIKESVTNDNGFCVAANKIANSNGNTDTPIKTTNGDKSITEPEAIKVLHDNTNHVVEADLKAVNTAAAITTSNIGVPSDEQVEKETDQKVDDVVVSADDIAPTVEQPSTVAS